MRCKICQSNTKKVLNGEILNKYQVDYYACENCYFLQTEEPYWLDESYNESIHASDTGILSRNLFLSNITTSIIYSYFNKSGKYLDYAGGYGVFTRLMRDIGVDYYWQDKYSDNLLARGFDYIEGEKYEIVTAFEAFEHFSNPIEEIKNMLKLSDTIFFTTEVISHPVPELLDWWYYGLNHGQHISFYNVKTLGYIADKYGLNLYTNDRNFHLFTKKKLSQFFFKNLIRLSNRGLGNFHKKKFKSKIIEDYEKLKNSK